MKIITVDSLWKRRWLLGWAEIIDGICSVVSLGMLTPNLSFNLIHWITVRNYKRRRGNKQ